MESKYVVPFELLDMNKSFIAIFGTLYVFLTNLLPLSLGTAPVCEMKTFFANVFALGTLLAISLVLVHGMKRERDIPDDRETNKRSNISPFMQVVHSKFDWENAFEANFFRSKTPGEIREYILMGILTESNIPSAGLHSLLCNESFKLHDLYAEFTTYKGINLPSFLFLGNESFPSKDLSKIKRPLFIGDLLPGGK